jgi:hypothetical protein
MKNDIKTIILSGLFSCVLLQLNAQGSGMVSGMFEQSRRHHREAYLSSKSIGYNIVENKKYELSVVEEQGGDTIYGKGKVKVYLNEPLSSFELDTGSGKKFYSVFQHKKPEVLIKNGKGLISGVPHRGRWIFNVYSGKDLILYARIPRFHVYYTGFYKTGNDSIREITPEFVAGLVKGNKKAEKALQKENIGKALHIYIKDEKKKAKKETRSKFPN